MLKIDRNAARLNADQRWLKITSGPQLDNPGDAKPRRKARQRPRNGTGILRWQPLLAGYRTQHH